MKNTAMIPKSIVAIRVFLNIGILRKKAAARSAATGLACRARGVVRAGVGRIIQVKQNLSISNKVDFATLIC
ncbi:hypothetical protein [Achromobacter xylosoxidans]|uniref:hypothetical protein n=1 Tax=Alcaligenes xylosoxydans xylosoxydans TaxID=85698 RepID=UPI00292D938C|nr:hypothetical protein [Achromobacter xylosoxidans]WOB73009.1 hypothetical protein PZA07_27690 [Achromobacter xylosoxidans]